MLELKVKLRDFCFYFVLLAGLLSNYLEFFLIWKIMLIVLCVLLLCAKINKSSVSISKYILYNILILLFVLIAISLIIGRITYLPKNIWTVFPTILVMTILGSIEKRCFDYIKIKLEKNFILLNIIWIFNLFALTLQVSGVHFLIKDSGLAVNAYYEDSCSGIFGTGGTHILALYAIFILILNFFMCVTGKIKLKASVLIYTLISEFYMLYLCTLSDNNAFIFLLPIFILSIWALTRKMNMKVNFKHIVIALFIVLLPFAAYTYIPGLAEFIERTTMSRLSGFFIDATVSGGSNERIMVAKYAFENGPGFKLGYGFGSFALDESGVAGFTHFGINCFSTIIFLCGIWIYFLWLFIYTKLITLNIYEDKFLFIIDMMICFVISLYSDPFWDMTMSIWLFFIIYLIGKCRKVILNN